MAVAEHSVTSTSNFAAFEAYDFAADPKFCIGWENIKKTLQDAQPEVQANKLLEAKIFYFSKFFGAVNATEYREHMLQKQISAPQELLPLSSPAVGDNKENGDGSLSFSEVMERVERGEKLPGVEDLNIEPTNTEVTESQCNRVKKPWEN